LRPRCALPQWLPTSFKAEAIETLGPNASQYAINNAQRNETALVCPRCSSAFGVTRWRNYCCACGTCVCFDCSKRTRIVVVGLPRATVCNDCPEPEVSQHTWVGLLLGNSELGTAGTAELRTIVSIVIEHCELLRNQPFAAPVLLGALLCSRGTVLS